VAAAGDTTHFRNDTHGFFGVGQHLGGMTDSPVVDEVTNGLAGPNHNGNHASVTNAPAVINGLLYNDSFSGTVTEDDPYFIATAASLSQVRW